MAFAALFSSFRSPLGHMPNHCLKKANPMKMPSEVPVDRGWVTIIIVESVMMPIINAVLGA
jgi:hypothetical protein